MCSISNADRGLRLILSAVLVPVATSCSTPPEPPSASAPTSSRPASAVASSPTAGAPSTPAAASRGTTAAAASTTPRPSTSRGVEASPLPDFVTSNGIDRVAFEFVRIAATPDARMDATPTSSWARAAALCTPELAQTFTTQRNPAGGVWWQDQIRPRDAFVSVEVTNIEGAQPQAPGSTPSGPAEVVVRFHDRYHYPDHLERNMKLREWTLTIGPGGRVADVVPDSTN